ncbi:MAG: glutaredoxin 3 [Acidiferrobacteraceae bacterium]
MAQVRMYCTHACPYCHMAARLLERRGAQVEKIQIDEQPELRAEMRAATGQTSVPQIFIGDRHVGGYRDLAQLDLDGALAALLAAP